MIRTIIPFLSLLAVVMLFAGMTIAQDKAATLTENDVKALIEEYIQENPEVIIQALQNHDIEQRQKEEAQAAERLDDHTTYLNSDELPSVGNPDGDIHIVEFFDYNCGYCKRAFSDLQILLQADENVKVTFVEMPILGEGSLEASKWSMAAAGQGGAKYFDYHTALMAFSGQKTEANMRSLAQAAGLDLETLIVASKDQAIINQIEKNLQVARDIGIRGTPGFIVNGEIYRGYLGYEGLKAVIDEIRMSEKGDANPAAEAPATNG